MKLATRIYLLAAGVLAAGAISAFCLIVALNGTDESYGNILRNQMQQEDNARLMQVTLKKETQAWKNILIRGANAEDLRTHRDELHAAGQKVEELARALAGDVADASTRELLQAFQSAHEALRNKQEAALALIAQSGGQHLQEADSSTRGMDRGPSDAVDRIVAAILETAHHAVAATERSNRRTANLASAIVIASFPCVGIFSIFVVRRIQNTLRQAITDLNVGAQQVSSAAGQVSSASQSLAAGSSEEAASLEETSASSEEVNSMTRRNMENARAAARDMNEAETRIAEANRALADMTGSMNQINESSGRISKIIRIIDEIAFQTNILALNAAVEAARAGEAGMGFAVVADEVRSLAHRSAQAARDTAGLIEDSIARANAGKEKLNQVTASVSSIAEIAGKVKIRVDEVHLASEEQGRGIDQIAKALAQIEQVTQSTAANAQENSAASAELSSQARAINLVVLRLRALVTGEADTDAHQQIEMALAAHAAWKERLRQAIDTRSSATPVDTVRRDDQCAFGKWLTGPTLSRDLKRTAGYEKCRRLHSRFHAAAGSVLAAALAGRKDEANRAMCGGSEFAEISTQLTSALVAWDESLKTVHV